MNARRSPTDSLPGELDAAERELALALREALRESEQALDFVATSKLRAARARAIAEPPRPQRRWLLAGLGSSALAVALLVIVARPWPAPTPTPADWAHGEALEVLLDEDDPELYEDLDLYRWLAQGAGNA